MAQQTGSEVRGTINHMKRNGTLWLVIFGFAAGIILLIIGGIGVGEERDDETPKADGEICLDIYEYERLLESDISDLCRRVTGGEVFVAVRLESGVEYVYASNVQTQSGGGTRSEYVIIGSGSSAEALYLCERPPKIAGIGVVCRGGGGQSVRNEISALLSAAYGVSMSRIYVTESE